MIRIKNNAVDLPLSNLPNYFMQQIHLIGFVLLCVHQIVHFFIFSNSSMEDTVATPTPGTSTISTTLPARHQTGLCTTVLHNASPFIHTWQDLTLNTFAMVRSRCLMEV